jgi:hypothetical protein
MVKKIKIGEPDLCEPELSEPKMMVHGKKI